MTSRVFNFLFLIKHFSNHTITSVQRISPNSKFQMRQNQTFLSPHSTVRCWRRDQCRRRRSSSSRSSNGKSNSSSKFVRSRFSGRTIFVTYSFSTEFPLLHGSITPPFTPPSPQIPKVLSPSLSLSSLLRRN